MEFCILGKQIYANSLNANVYLYQNTKLIKVGIDRNYLRKVIYLYLNLGSGIYSDNQCRYGIKLVQNKYEYRYHYIGNIHTYIMQTYRSPYTNLKSKTNIW